MVKVEDHLGRRFEKLRVSLINSCNFACVYCVSDDSPDSHHVEKEELISLEEQLNVSDFVTLIQGVHQLIGLKSIRLTGGEPLMYPHLIPLIEKIKAIGIDDIRLTTNAYYLKERAEKLKVAGLKSVNISIDAINIEIFKKLTRHHNPLRVFDGIEAALKAGLNLKLNAVIMRGINESEIIPLLDYASKLGVKIRYLELMKMGYLYEQKNELFYSEEEILKTIQQQYLIQRLPRKQSETSRYWSAGGKRIFGIIANESTPFCHDCNRLRMDSQGNFFGCLSNSKGEKLAPYINNEIELENKLRQLLMLKQPVKFHGSELSMRNIGG